MAARNKQDYVIERDPLESCIKWAYKKQTFILVILYFMQDKFNTHLFRI